MKYILFGARVKHRVTQTNKIHTNFLCSLGFVEIISLPQIGVQRGVFLANHLA